MKYKRICTALLFSTAFFVINTTVEANEVGTSLEDTVFSQQKSIEEVAHQDNTSYNEEPVEEIPIINDDETVEEIPISNEEEPTKEIPIISDDETIEEIPIINEEEPAEEIPITNADESTEEKTNTKDDKNTEEIPITNTEESTKEKKITKKNTQNSSNDFNKAQTRLSPSANDILLNTSNFKDQAFVDYLKRFDFGNKGWLTKNEIENIFVISLYGQNYSDLTGIKLIKNLQVLAFSGTKIKNLDVSGMNKLLRVNFTYNNDLTTLDFRNCDNLRVGWHSINDETVFISAGMLNYIGCDNIPDHTGNIVIDLAGFYKTNPDGSKSVDLTKVISPELLKIFSKYEQYRFNKNTNILTIDANLARTQYSVGEYNWTFITKLNKVDDIVVSFESNGGTLISQEIVSKGGSAKQPTDPYKEGYNFGGWYLDPELTILWDFKTLINEDLTLYALWSAIDPINPIDPVDPVDPVEVVDLVTDSPKSFEEYTVVKSSILPNILPQTGEEDKNLFSLIGISLLSFGGIILNRKK